MKMMLRHDTASTLPEDRVRRLRELLARMTDRFGEHGPMIAAIRKNLAAAEAAQTDAQDGQVSR